MSRPSEESLPPEARYSNHFRVGFNAFEMVIEFGQHYAESEELQSHTRIITNPAHAKELAELLEGAIQDYERVYGRIPREQDTRENNSHKEHR